ncbi:hypothetical protein [Streptococcus ruminantium]|uniref:hypothetical protein n=2 Tax=Streptococcus ruminantium TaxID=1917441 RepID=UPI0012DF71CE|nr:hypothetical protein [Streptococcus ruminantium]
MPDQQIWHSIFLKEAVIYKRLPFFQKASSTLILTDMIENIETEKMGFCHKLLYKIGDNTYPNGKTPCDLRLTFLGQKKEDQVSFQVLKNWGPKTSS